MCRIALSLACSLGLLVLLTGGCKGPHYGSHESGPAKDAALFVESESEPEEVADDVVVPTQDSDTESAQAPEPGAPPQPGPSRQPAPTKPPVPVVSPVAPPPPMPQTTPVEATSRRRATSAQSSTAIAPLKGPWVSAREWTRANGLGSLQRVSMGDDPSFEFNTPRGRFLFQVRNHQAMWAGMQLHLGFEPQMVGDEPCLHQLDLEKNLHPLLLTAPWSAWAGGTVVLDPGHGGVQSGTRSVLDGSVEKTYTLDWALRLKPLLEHSGWKVLLTRTRDSELSLSNRVAFANNAKADLFLSLHFNAAGGGNHQVGLETYCLTPTGMPSTLTRGYADDPAELLPNNAFDDENVRLAAALHRSILGVNGGLDRGLRRARFMTVLRGTECPAVLVEGGFLSNPDEAARIADPMFRQKLAEAVARVLTPPMQPAGS